jgi:hypothetical protein
MKSRDANSYLGNRCSFQLSYGSPLLKYGQESIRER